MANTGNSKLKLLYVLQILREETDDEHGISMHDLIVKLQEHGINAERKALYRDLETLKEFGFDIRKYPRSPVEYALKHREFTHQELMLLVDAVSSCKLLTATQAKALVKKLKTMASKYQRSMLSRQIHVPDRITSKAHSVLPNVDVLHEAMRRKVKVEFAYYRRNWKGERRKVRESRAYLVTPVEITYVDGFYYLTAWSDVHKEMREYRVDRMEALRLVEDSAESNEEIMLFGKQPDSYERFGRMGGREVAVSLDVSSEAVEIIYDRFGEKVAFRKVDSAGSRVRTVVSVHVSPQFFGWIAGMGGEVVIAEPQSLRDEYRAYLRSLWEDERVY